MSGNKMTDAKTSKDLNLDSGCHSGFVYDDDSSELRPELEEAEPKSSDDYSNVCLDRKVLQTDIGKVEHGMCDFDAKEVLQKDSGVVEDDICDLTDSFGDVKLVDYSTKTSNPVSMPTLPKNLPLELLFQQDDDGDTQLHIAAVHGLEKPISTLIRVCPNKELLNLCNDMGHTALHLGVMSGNAVVTRMLVLAGADIGIRDRSGETPLHKATALSHVKCMQALLMPVLHNLQRKMAPILNQKNYNGQACVHVAATLGHIESLQALLFYGADINLRENLAGRSPLHIAALRGSSRLVQYLLRCSAVDARAADYAGLTPRRLARLNQAASLFLKHEDSDTDDSDDDDMSDEEENYEFEKFANHNQLIAA